jgi:ribosomal protein S8
MVPTVLKNILKLKSQALYKQSVNLAFNKITVKILKILYVEGYLLSFAKIKNTLTVFFLINSLFQPLAKAKYCIKSLKKSYISLYDLQRFFKTSKLLILSTDAGLLTLTQCKRAKIGGLLVLVV